MSSHPNQYSCPECGTSKGSYTPRCRACRRRRSRTEHQRLRRNGTRTPRIVVEGGQAVELRRTINTAQRVYRAHRDELPLSLALAIDTLLQVLHQILQNEQP